MENGTTYEYKSDYDLLLVEEDEEKAHRTKFAKRLKRRILKNVETDTAGLLTSLNASRQNSLPLASLPGTTPARKGLSPFGTLLF